jgi:uncharacterized protein YgbK (DUF1537 family)
LGDVGEAAVWLQDGAGLAVCDATTTADLDAIGVLWAAADGVLLAGPAAVIGAGAAAVAAAAGGAAAVVPVGGGAAAVAAVAGGAAPVSAPVVAGPPRSVPPSPAPALLSPVLVVAGTLHPAARQQVEALAAGDGGAVVIEDPVPPHSVDVASRALGAGRTVVLTTSMPPAVRVAHDEAQRTARALANACRRVVAASTVGTLVVLGGDTAAAVLGPEALAVGGMMAPGTPWARRPDGVLVVTRAGGFGTASALVDLLAARAAR